LDRYSPSQEADASIQSRSAIQQLGLTEAIRHPVAGLGPGAFEERAKALRDPNKPSNLQTDVLNTYLQAALVGGIPALLAFLAIYALSAGPALRAVAPLGFGLVGAATALLTLNGLTLPSLWFALGLAASMFIRETGTRTKRTGAMS
jgi:O-antigen ligase